VSESDLRELVYSLRQKLTKRDEVIEEQQQLMQHFILNDKPLAAQTSESKRLAQFYKQKM